MTRISYSHKWDWHLIANIQHHLLLVSVFLLLGFSSNAQARKLTISMKNAPLEQVLAAIQKQSGLVVMYSSSVLRNAKRVNIDIKDATIEAALDRCLYDQPLNYKIINNNIIITSKQVDNKQPSPNNPPHPIGPDTSITVSGTVTAAATGAALAGVTVVEKGTRTGTTTNDQGAFTLRGVSGPNATLQFRSVGYIPVETPLNARRNIVVRMNVDIAKVNEVTVVSTGYQDIPKERATGSFSFVDNELFNRSISTNVLDRLKGVVSGLNIEPRNALNPDKSSISIRGISTINANMKPLLVVDGFPYDEGGGFGVINNLNPNDIESVTVLKDAAAASIWGVNAGNGVIVITTKKGRYGQKPMVSVTSNVTITEKPDLFYLPTMKSSDEMTLETTLFNSGYYQSIEDQGKSYNYFLSPLPSLVELLIAKRDGRITDQEAASQIKKLTNHDVRDDISKYLLRKNVNQQYAVNVSGGGEKTIYYMSIGYDNNNYSNANDQYNRFSIRVDNTFRPINKLEINGYISYVQSNDRFNNINWGSLLPTGSNLMAPYTRLADDDGNAQSIPKDLRSVYVDTAQYPALLDWHFRPLQDKNYSDNKIQQFDTRFGGAVKYIIVSGLTAEVKGQYQKYLVNGRNYNGLESYYTRDLINKYMYNNSNLVYPIPIGGILDFNTNVTTSWNLRGQVDFSKRWKQNQIVVLAGYEAREVKKDYNASRKYGYDPEINTFNQAIDYSTIYLFNPLPYSGSARIPNGDATFGSLNRYLSYFGNGAYTLKDKYIVSVSGRIDQSNFFGVKANNRRVPLWSTGLSWVLSNEKFYPFDWLPYLKLRTTYGYSGNTNNKASSFVTARYSPADGLTDLPSATILNPPNPELTWEKVLIENFGLDFSSRNKMLAGSVEYYHKNGQGLIGPITVDPTTGVKSFVGNKASIVGNGIDIVINTLTSVGKLNWSTSLLFSYSTDKVTAYEKIASIYEYTNGTTAGTSIAPFKGRPLFSLYSFKSGGLDPANGAPRGVLADTIASYSTLLTSAKPEDLVFSGHATPTVFGSLRNNVSYEGISISFNIIYKFGYYFRRSSINYSNLVQHWNGHADFSRRWQIPGDETKTDVPSLSTIPDGNRDNAYLYSDRLIEKADHIRLQDIRLSYNLRVNKQKRSPLKNAEIYFYANNIGILWRANKRNIDPEYGDYNLPTPRSYSMGINLSF